MPFSLPTDILVVFFGAAILLAMAPGPDNFYVLTQSALRGRQVGFMITLGLCTGLIFHTTLVVIGVAVLIQTSPTAFSLLQLAGALYLIYLAILAFRFDPLTAAKDSTGRLELAGYYQRGIVMNISNPKVALFFLSFLPQFAKPEYGVMAWQLAALGLLFMLSTLLVFSSIAALAGAISPWLLTRPLAQQILQRLAGWVFIAIAAYILVNTLPALI